MLATCSSFAAGPLNDQQANAIPISGRNLTLTGSNLGASKEAGEANHATNSGGASVYWLWTLPSGSGFWAPEEAQGGVEPKGGGGVSPDVRLAINTYGSDFDTLLAIYIVVGSDVYPFASNDDAGGTLQSGMVRGFFSGYTYLIAVDGYNADGTPGSAAQGHIRLNISSVPGIGIVDPAENAMVTAPSNIPISVTITSTPAGIQRVEFFTADGKLGESRAAPYGLIWSNVFPGDYQLWATITDNNDLTASSTTVNLTVYPPGFVSLSLVPAQSSWRYLDTGANLGTTWRAAEFDDTDWAAGPGPLGYGDAHIRTTVNSGPAGSFFITTYFRRAFVLANTGRFSTLTLRTLADDGAVVFLNDQQVYRSNLPQTVGYQTRALNAVGGAAETAYRAVRVDPSHLVTGTNYVVVEVHQQSPTSSDLGFDLELIGGVASTLRLVSPTNNVVLNEPASLPVSALASAATGSISKVIFYASGELIGAATASPFVLGWNNVPAGDYALQAVAIDSAGLSMTSAVVNVRVVRPEPPRIVAVRPAAGQVTNLDTVRISFNKGVAGVNASDLLINGQSALKAVTADQTNFIFAFPRPAAGPVSISWVADHGISDTTLPPLAFNAVDPTASWIYYAAPRLGISRGSSARRIHWPITAAGFELEASPQLGSLAEWQTVTNVSSNGPDMFVLDPSTNTQQFFRLRWRP